MTDANAVPDTESVRILLAEGVYPLSDPTPTALAITFAGPSLTLETYEGPATLNGMGAVRMLSVGSASNVTIDGLAFELGSTTGLGGAIENSGHLIVKDARFSANTAGNGGAIGNNANATLKVENSTFARNTTTGVGGGAIISHGTTTILRSAIVNNRAPINGGGVNVQPGGTMTITSSTVAGNSSGGLGGGFANLGTLDVQASTVIGNTGSDGGAIASGNANITLAASILTSPSPTCSPANALVDGGYNLDDDGTCVSPDTPATGSHAGTAAYGSSTYDAALDAYLADGPARNGGPTQTLALLNSPVPATSLANPAFDVVPPGFDLPVAVDGQTAACSLPDQRGVAPAPGANCAIGAYLLQATKTTVTTSAATAEKGEAVTYTATVAPAVDGGTVTFDDGAGNPATNQCASRDIANGIATCTVIYPDPGVYTVRAAYSGDGALNNFAPSASGNLGAAKTTVLDTPPSPRPLRILGATPNRKTGAITVKVSIPAPGTVKLVGYKRLKSTSKHFRAKGTYKFKVTPKGKFKRMLAKRGKGYRLVKFKYVPDAGQTLIKGKVFRFVKTIKNTKGTKRVSG